MSFKITSYNCLSLKITRSSQKITSLVMKMISLSIEDSNLLD